MIDSGCKFDILHFAGHVYFDDTNPGNSGLIMSDGKLEATLLERYFEIYPPKLVFINGCTSASGSIFGSSNFFENKLYGLAQSFVKLGSCYLGSYWPLFDQPSTQFALYFYHFIASGYPISEAVRRSRLLLYSQLNGRGLTWASYTLFGDFQMRLTPFRYRFTTTM